MSTEHTHQVPKGSWPLEVGFRSNTLELEVLKSTTVRELKENLEMRLNVPVANQKLVFKGKTLHDDCATVAAIGVFPSIVGGKAVSHKPRQRLLLIGSTTADVEASRSPPPQGKVRDDFDETMIPKGYKKVVLNTAGPDLSPYRFERIETLPGLPEEDKARAILESLANDPGIKAVLEKHQWTVGALCEMYPEGKVGVSKVCVMGLNQNSGMKILLRLRTDDLKGFRKILSIRKVLFHELAHNEFSDHDDNFYRLMRQVEREAAELDWRQHGGRTTGSKGRSPGRFHDQGGGGGGYVLVKEAFEGGSGRLGGASEGLTRIFTASALAGQAAVLRLSPEEQEVEDGCVHAHSKDLYNPPPPPVEHGPDGEMAVPLSSATFLDQEKEAMDVEAEYEAAVAGGDAGHLDVPVVDMVESPPLSREGQLVKGQVLAEKDDHGAAVMPPHADVEMTDSPMHKGVPPMSESLLPSTEAPAPSTARTPTVVVLSASGISSTPLPAPPSAIDELIAMGFKEEEGKAALSVSSGSLSGAVQHLLLQGESGVATSPTAASVAVEAGQGESMRSGVGMDNIGHAEGTSDISSPVVPEAEVVVGGVETEGGLLSREDRLRQAADAIVGMGDSDRAAQCLDVLVSMLQNIMDNPTVEKFQKVRQSNKRFQTVVGSVSGGIDILLAAGFEDKGDFLSLGRQDIGLIWLAKSTLEEQRSQMEKKNHTS